jgi:teichuronic acid biosynthesis glycosyltransferase TuaC
VTAQAARPLRVLSIATLFPDATRPNFGIFVERSLAAAARQPGVELTVVAPLGLPPCPLSLHPRYRQLARLPQVETWHGLTIHRPRFSLIPRLARRNAAAVTRAVLPLARRLVAEGGLDLVDAQFFWPDGVAAQQVASALGLPFSAKARGGDISLWARRADTAPLVLGAAQSAAGMLAVADSLADDMASLGMPRARIVTHHTGIDRAIFRPADRQAARAALGLPADAPVIVSVGALIPRKGQDHVIRALPLLPADCRYVIAGAGPERNRLSDLASALGVADRLVFTGAVPNADLPALYSAADAMVLMSASEGLANVWVEALACGTPLILSDIPPAHEVIDAPDAGSISASAPAELAAAVRALLASPRDRAALSARTHARFSWDRNGAELAAYWRSLAS